VLISPSLTILVPLWFIIISLLCFYLSRLLFSGFLQFKGNFVRCQNNSKSFDLALLTKSYACVFCRSVQAIIVHGKSSVLLLFYFGMETPTTVKSLLTLLQIVLFYEAVCLSFILCIFLQLAFV